MIKINDGKIRKKRNRIRKEDVLFLFFCMVTAAVFALYRCLNGDFVAYNGDFQNYNVFRRLLDGQVPYRDFTNYLGSGIVFVNLPLVAVFRSFGESVFITHFTTSLLYSFILCVALYTILHDRKKAYFITNLIAIAAFVILHAGFYSGFYYQYIYDLVYFEEQGISMRTTRAFLPFLLVGIFYVAKNAVGRKWLFRYCFRSYKRLAGIFFVLGMLTVWANDYGYANVVCFFLIFVMVIVFDRKTGPAKKMCLMAAAVFSALAGIILSIMIVTGGNIGEYISINAGVAEYQFWYYGNYYNKYLTVADLFSDRKYLFLTVFFFAHGIWFLYEAASHRIDDDRICRLFLHSTCYGASLIYVLGSGAHNYSAAELVSCILCIGVVIWLVKSVWIYVKGMLGGEWGKTVSSLEQALHSAANEFEKFRIPAYLFLMLLLYTFSVNIIRTDLSYADRETVKGLHIDSVLGAGLDECAAELAGEELFSTYAGALETINGVFQPTGTDYIIHVMGDKQREKYLENFINGDYRYASTLKNEYTHCEYWSSRVNWFFYRYLYQYYEPVAETNFSVIWEKKGNEYTVKENAQIDLTFLNTSTCKIEVMLPDYSKGAYVDLHIKYRTVWNENRVRKGGIKKLLCVEDGGEQYNSFLSNSCYYLRDCSEGCNIPVYVRDGKGTVYLSAYPLSCTDIENMEVCISDIIKEPEFNLHLANYKDIYSSISQNAVDATNMVLQFDNTEFNTTVLEGARELKSDGETGMVESVWKAGDYIYVQLMAPIEREYFLYPNRIEVEY